MSGYRFKLLVPEMPRAYELAPYLARLDRSRWYTNEGELVRELESRLGGAVCVSSCTSALETALAALELPRDAKVLCPSLTFPASATAIVRAGCVPVFCDVDAKTWMLTPEIAKKMVEHYDDIAAIVAVCAFGAANMGAWHRVGRPVIFDAAAAHGNQPAIAGDTSACFSLHATKRIGAGEGGFIKSASTEFLERCRSLSSFGFDRDGSREVTSIYGTNAKMSEYAAAVALASLDRSAAKDEYLITLASHYRDCIRELIPGARFQHRGAQEFRNTFECLLPFPTADETAMRLAAEGIETRRWYWPAMHEHRAFRGFPIVGRLEHTAEIGARLLGLPFHPGITLAQAGEITRVLARCAGVDTHRERAIA